MHYALKNYALLNPPLPSNFLEEGPPPNIH